MKIIGTQCLVDPMTVPLAARPMGSVATNFGVPDGGSGGASVANHGARNDAGTASTNGLANPIAAEAVTMIHVPAAIPAGVKDPNTHVVQASPFLGARTPVGTAYKRPLDGASSSTSGSPKKHRMEQVCTQPMQRFSVACIFHCYVSSRWYLSPCNLFLLQASVERALE